MQICRLSRADLDQLLQLYAHLHAADAPLPERAVVEATWSRLIEGDAYRYYGGTIDGQLICSCNLTVIPNLTRACRPFGVIENVVTHPEFRRRGFGRAILHKALGDAWGDGCYKVMLQTGRMDEATFRFYESAGFERHAKQAFVARPAV
jgi:GNAT superfamily N-acetyltransferase